MVFHSYLQDDLKAVVQLLFATVHNQIFVLYFRLYAMASSSLHVKNNMRTY